MHSICQQIWKTQQWPQDWKMSILIPVPKKGSTKECANHWIVAFISHASKVMLKILHARFQHYVNWELPDVQAGFRKGRGSTDHTANSHWIIEKMEISENTCLYFDCVKAFDYVDHDKLWKALRWQYQTVSPVSWETCMRVKKQQLEPCMEQLIGSRLKKEYDRAVCCHPVCLIYTLSTSREMPSWMSYMLESR